MKSWYRPAAVMYNTVPTRKVCTNSTTSTIANEVPEAAPSWAAPPRMTPMSNSISSLIKPMPPKMKKREAARSSPKIGTMTR